MMMTLIKYIDILGTRYIKLDDYIAQMLRARNSIRKCLNVDPSLEQSLETYDIIIAQLMKMK